MFVVQHMPYAATMHTLASGLIAQGRAVATKTWQGQDVTNNPAMATLELERVTLELGMVWGDEARQVIEPNLPWADDHFAERVSGFPLNPPPSAATWPFAQRGHTDHTDGAKQFSHTYPERFWPKHAGHSPSLCSKGDTEDPKDNSFCDFDVHFGIRYHWGDLYDIVELLKRDDQTRQAYLPVWFPEDTGTVKGQRVPCTLGYHFMVRHGKMHIIYYMRSCDFIRHFPDDVYLAMRLAEWVNRESGLNLMPGTLTMHISSLHVFKGDKLALDSINQKYQGKAAEALMEALAGGPR